MKYPVTFEAKQKFPVFTLRRKVKFFVIYWDCFVGYSNHLFFERRRSPGSHATVTRSHSSLYGMSRPSQDSLITHPLNRTSSHGHLSFEEMCRANETKPETWNDHVLTKDDDAREGVEMLSQRDFTRLQPLLWLELSAVFDKYNVPLVKRKPNKRRRKGKI